MTTNYFVCTLGQAALLKKEQDHEIRTINDLLDHRGLDCPDQPAVGFYLPSPDPSKPWMSRVLSFADVIHGSKVMSALLSQSIHIPSKETVALLCPSSPQLFFTWLGLIRLGHPVLLLAPQCMPIAIAQLCRSCEVSVLMYDELYEELAKKCEEIGLGERIDELRCQRLPIPATRSIFDVVTQPRAVDVPISKVEEYDVAYLHHTSGTSTGIPKPIPQSHWAAVGALPKLDGEHAATFTTTPLYHGGIADVFRAWTSKALIGLFPGRDVPITARNIVRCLGIAKAGNEDGMPPIKYFSSVPYVLQMMADDEEGLKLLQEMDIVGVGGAALPAEVGDRLVAQGVNLVSRFGSAECGFLMSSHRDYQHDKEWQYLRPGDGVEALRFEQRDAGLSELVVVKGWPHMAKHNREDGSYATADLFQPHPTILNAWRYHSRADSQLTLITGKKFDPAPMEAAIATSPLLADVFIFGNGKPYPGALLFRSREAQTQGVSDEDLIHSVATLVEKSNCESQEHARIPNSMLLLMPHDESALEKSSKGTILRSKAEGRYREKIEEAYGVVTSGYTDLAAAHADGALPSVIHEVVKSITGMGDLQSDTDLFTCGVDSLACMRIRQALSQFIPISSLPLTVVEDCGTIESLARFVLAKRNGSVAAGSRDPEKVMVELVEEYGTFDRTDAPEPVDTYETVLLTGATGGLGAHVLNTYLLSANISRIYCLVRGADQTAVEERVVKAMEARKLTSLRSKKNTLPQVMVLPALLGSPHLGLPKTLYDQIASEVTIIQHVAWAVNFRIQLQSFIRDHIAGLRSMITFALACQKTPRFIFCSSVASVREWPASDTIPEKISDDPKTAGSLGYSRSKWVAEQICRNAHQQTKLRGRIAVMRVGQLSGDTEHGIWSMTEAYPLMLSTVQAIQCLPNLPNEHLDWLPLDVAAQAFVETAERMKDLDLSSIGVYHIVNNHRSVQWADLLGWMKKVQDFDVVRPDAWVDKLEEYGRQDKTHPALKLLGHWRRAFSIEASGGPQGANTETVLARYAMEHTYRMSAVMKSVRPVDEQYLQKLWTWISDNSADVVRI